MGWETTVNVFFFWMNLAVSCLSLLLAFALVAGFVLISGSLFGRLLDKLIEMFKRKKWKN